MSCEKSNNTINLKEIDAILKGLKAEDMQGNLIAILQHAQEIYGYLSKDIILYISKKTNIAPAKVFGVVTFYTQFRTKPVGKHLILICKGTACHVCGASNIEEAIKETIKVNENEISEDGLFTYSNVACLGCCSLAPAMMIGDKTYGNLTEESTRKILWDIELAEQAN